MFENGCYLRRQKRFKCPIRQAQKAAQRTAAATAGRLTAESGTSASRDLNRKLTDDDVTSGMRRSSLSNLQNVLRQFFDGVTSQDGVAGSRDLNRKLSDERSALGDERRRFNNCVAGENASVGTELTENQNGVGGVGHVTYDTSVSGASYRGLNPAQPLSGDKAFSSHADYRYQHQTVKFYVTTFLLMI